MHVYGHVCLGVLFVYAHIIHLCVYVPNLLVCIHVSSSLYYTSMCLAINWCYKVDYSSLYGVCQKYHTMKPVYKDLSQLMQYSGQ